jgi:ribosomal protein L19
MEFNQEYLMKFLKDGTLTKKDLLDFYIGDDVKERYKIIEKEINNL